jgi:hypothetical protein
LPLELHQLQSDDRFDKELIDLLLKARVVWITATEVVHLIFQPHRGWHSSWDPQSVFTPLGRMIQRFIPL